MSTPPFNILKRNLAVPDSDVPAVGCVGYRAPRKELMQAHQVAVKIMREHTAYTRYKACKLVAEQCSVKFSTLYMGWDRHQAYIDREQYQEANHGG